jgi:alkyl hydroperoxide reductase subunit AhpF
MKSVDAKCSGISPGQCIDQMASENLESIPHSTGEREIALLLKHQEKFKHHIINPCIAKKRKYYAIIMLEMQIFSGLHRKISHKP